MFKSEKIKQSLKKTLERRKNQICKTYEIKIDKSHLSCRKKQFLKMLFIEAKWLYNYMLASNTFDDKIKITYNFDKDRNTVKHELKYLSSQMKQSLVKRTKDTIKALSILKNKGYKIGKLKFKSQVNSIPLKQYGNTYKILDKKYIKIQGLNKRIKVNGLSQIPVDAEFANATLVNKCDDYYLYVTVYQSKNIQDKKLCGKIGLDFGIKNSVTTSEGNKYNYIFEETKQIKKAQKKLFKKKKGSRNRYKQKKILVKYYNKLNNLKKDAKNKLISQLKNKELIAIQDEQIANWHKNKRFSRKVQHDIMGGIISDLKKMSQTVIIDRFEPTTKKCFICNNIVNITLKDRVFKCEKCGFEMDRDVKSAIYILLKGIKISMERRNTMPVENESSVFNQLIKNKICLMKQEATLL